MPMFPKEHQVSSSSSSELLSCIDPTVVASEKKVLWILCYELKKENSFKLHVYIC